MGKVATTPTSASIVAAFQTQEALKLIHDMEVQPGKALLINGLTNDIYTTEYPVKEMCMSHSRLEPIIELPDVQVDKTSLAELLASAREEVGEDASLEFSGELVVAMTCNYCQEETPIFKRMARLYEGETACPECGRPRDLVLTHRITGEEDFLERTLAEVDIPPLDIVRARGKEAQVYLELTGDKESFLRFS
jgi:adenylyltransferase/sulfurtransferase